MRFLKPLALATAAMVLCGLLPAKAERKTHAEMVHAAIDTHILPRLERLATATSHLEAAVASICSGAKGGRIGADAAFKETVLAWGAIDFVRFGPIAEGHRLERFFFWPDPRGITARQLSAALAKRDEALLAPGALATQSAAIQGLSALEMLLYDQAHPLDAAGDDARYRCAYASAIAANLRTIAHEVSEAWQGPEGWHMKMEAPGSDNPLYKDFVGDGARGGEDDPHRAPDRARPSHHASARCCSESAAEAPSPRLRALAADRRLHRRGDRLLEGAL